AARLFESPQPLLRLLPQKSERNVQQRGIYPAVVRPVSHRQPTKPPLHIRRQLNGKEETHSGQPFAELQEPLARRYAAPDGRSFNNCVCTPGLSERSEARKRGSPSPAATRLLTEDSSTIVLANTRW